MKRAALEHIIRAAVAITGANEIVIIGSQSILGPIPDAPTEALRSMEADVFTFRDPNDAELIDGSIGEKSAFHESFGYYAHGVSSETAVLPAEWRNRLVRIENENTGGGAGLCLDAHDLAVSKLIAGRQKDIEFLEILVQSGHLNSPLISMRLQETALENDLRVLCKSRQQVINKIG